MNDAIERLVNVLEKESDLYGEMGDLLEKERESFVGLDMNALEEALGTKAVLLGRIHRLEQERRALTTSMAQSQGLNEEGLTLAEIARTAPTPWAGRLMGVREALREKVGLASERNEWNREFVNAFNAVMDGIMENLRAAVTGPGTYGRKGNFGSNGTGGGDFVRQAV